MRRCLYMDLAGTLIKDAGMVGDPTLTAGMDLTEVAVRGEQTSWKASSFSFVNAWPMNVRMALATAA